MSKTQPKLDYSTLPIEKYIALRAVPFEGREEVDYMMDLLSIVFDTTPDELSVMPIMEFSRLCGQIQFLNELPKAGRLRTHLINVDGWELTVTPSAAQMQTNQYVDFQTFTAQEGDHTIEQLSCLLVPVGHRYNEGYDMAALHKSLGLLPTQMVMDITAFFFSRSLLSIKATLTSLAWMSHFRRGGKEMRKMIREARRHLLQASRAAGDGSTPSTRSARPAASPGMKYGSNRSPKR